LIKGITNHHPLQFQLERNIAQVQHIQLLPYKKDNIEVIKDAFK